MKLQTFQTIVGRYPSLKVAVLGDFCLDRYLEIDPALKEISIETGLPVHNVVNVRAQPGAAGTILNNLSALGITNIFPIGFVGDDGEGFELMRALELRAGVKLDHLVKSAQRRTFTYCKPLLMAQGKAPVELNRLDSKNWTPTPRSIQELLIGQLEAAASRTLNAVVVLDQVDIPETGVVTPTLLDRLKLLADANPELLILADSRRGLRGFPPLVFKMNAAELSSLTGARKDLSLEEVKATALRLASANRRTVFVTLAERGMVGASPTGQVEHVTTLPIRGEIDIVGAGDAVSANLMAALAAGADLREALELASAGASVVIHKLGTTGAASVPELERALKEAGMLSSE